jgi:hypothetical protein
VDLVGVNGRESLEELFNRRAAVEVLEQGGDGHKGASKTPVPESFRGSCRWPNLKISDDRL